MANRGFRLPVFAALAVAGIAFWAAPARAVEGVVQINQAKALAGAVTAGDGAGFPVTISESGSYRLTSDLTVPDANTNAVSITADSVTLDLNGFSIAGPTTCTYSGGVSCGGTEGTGTGVVAATSRVSVRNGRVRGMGSNAIELGALGRVEDVDVVSNGGAGITLGDEGLALRNWVSLNLGSGITAGNGARVGDNRVVVNDATSISLGADASVTGNYVGRSADGITATSDAAVVGNVCYGPSGTGISLASGGLIASNLIDVTGADDGVSVGQAVTVRHNVILGGAGADGIEADSGNTIIGNTVLGGGAGGSYGVRFTGSGNGYMDNVILNPSGNDVTAYPSGVELGTNFCCDLPDPASCAGEITCPYGE
jgi:hypothetical protein